LDWRLFGDATDPQNEICSAANQLGTAVSHPLIHVTIQVHYHVNVDHWPKKVLL
jgi:hypothetical protein